MLNTTDTHRRTLLCVAQSQKGARAATIYMQLIEKISYYQVYLGRLQPWKIKSAARPFKSSTLTDMMYIMGWKESPVWLILRGG